MNAASAKMHSLVVIFIAISIISLAFAAHCYFYPLQAERRQVDSEAGSQEEEQQEREGGETKNKFETGDSVRKRNPII